jgi:drug/metabolite transporter (DMT)-like permease
MHFGPQLIPIAFSLVAVLTWGTSDFIGGYACKDSDPFLVTALAHASGFCLMAVWAMAEQAPFPAVGSELWALLAGALGGVALAIFYRTLAGGTMGLTAPVAAVLGAAIPTIFAMFTEGVPGLVPICGFVLAAAGIWLISRPEGGFGRPKGIWMAVLAGVGFAGFFICINRTGSSSALWSAATSRFASLVLVLLIVLARRTRWHLSTGAVLLGLVAGWLDSTGTMLFIRADQTGRLDAAVVISSLYPAVTVLLARLILHEHFTRWKAVGMVAAILAVPMIAAQ